MRFHFGIIGILVFLWLEVSLCSIVNTKVKRTIDISTPIVKISTDVEFTGGTGVYDVIVPNTNVGSLAYMTVKDKESESILKFESKGNENNHEIFQVHVKVN